MPLIFLLHGWPRKKAQIEAQTEAYKAVESAIAKAAASEAGANPAIVERAVEVLVRKSYREQRNREGVAIAALEELKMDGAQEAPSENLQEPEPEQPDEEWLNVFEQYAERASTERMQKLWGRVLAGEIRRPGRFSMRALRFLSEFSQSDAIDFEDFCKSAFAGHAPTSLVRPGEEDISKLLAMESAGLLQGASGLGLQLTLTFDARGLISLSDGQLRLILRAGPNEKVQITVVALTPIAQELLSLLPGRDVKDAARRFAAAARTPAIKMAMICAALPNGQVMPIEVLWDEGTQNQTAV